MKVLLTGGTGFVGRYVVKALERRGIECITLQRTFLDCHNSIQIDLLSTNDLERIFLEKRATHLVHLAWYAEHRKYWQSESNLKWIAATKRLIEAFCSAGGEHVLVSGTCAEYDWTHGYLTEDLTPLNPDSLYGISKDATRKIIEPIIKKYEISLSWARLFFPYGEGESEQRLIPSLLRAFNGDILPFAVNASSYRDFMHVEDAASAILACLESKKDGAINICSGKPIQIRDVVEMVAKISNKNKDLILGLEAKRKENNNFLVGNNNRIFSLDWKQKILLEDGLSKYMQIINKK